MKLTFDYVFVVPLQILNRKVNSELYATHVNHEHHLLPLFATAIAMVKSILILQTSATIAFLHMRTLAAHY
jgi:hypothetical protein